MGWMILWIAVAGLVGGLANALVSDNGFAMWKVEEGVWRPGALGTAFLGAIGALIVWGLYGPLSGATIVGGAEAPAATLSMADLIGALVSGLGGGRIITAEMDKRALRQAAAVAREKSIADPEQVETEVAALKAKAPFDALRTLVRPVEDPPAPAAGDGALPAT